MLTRIGPALLVFFLLCAAAEAAGPPISGTLYDCSGTIGGTAANISFPKAGTSGPVAPSTYLAIENNSTSSQVVWFSPLPGVTATTAPPSWQLVPTSGFYYTSTDPVPPQVSVIASASGAAYTCHYQ